MFETAELVPVRPVGHEVGVGDQHPWRPFVGAHHADRLARLDEHRLVVLERGERAQHRPVRVPRTGGATGAAVDDEPVGVLGHLGIEVVLQHPIGRLLRPASTGQVGPARRADAGDGRAEIAERVTHVLQSAPARRTVSTNDKTCHQLTIVNAVACMRTVRQSAPTRSSLRTTTTKGDTVTIELVDETTLPRSIARVLDLFEFVLATGGCNLTDGGERLRADADHDPALPAGARSPRLCRPRRRRQLLRRPDDPAHRRIAAQRHGARPAGGDRPAASRSARRTDRRVDLSRGERRTHRHLRRHRGEQPGDPSRGLGRPERRPRPAPRSARRSLNLVWSRPARAPWNPTSPR